MKTSVGLTDKFVLNENVLQGDVFGNILASNQIDKFGKECLEEERNIYLYRDSIPIVPLAICDDLLVISECGYQTNLAVAYLNSQASFNYLQFGLSKCAKMHIGKSKQNFKRSPVFHDNWTSEEKENIETGKIESSDNYRGKMKIKDVSDVKYLGNKLNSDGSNMLDITMKCNRGVGTINKIQNNLETMFFGKYYFEIGITLIESMLLGTILTNIEVAYNLTLSAIEKSEKCHEMPLRKLLNLPSKTPIPMLYFLTGSTPIRFIVKRRRLFFYLHHILKQEEESLIRYFFEKQMLTRKSKDWASQIVKDLSEFGIQKSLYDISLIREESWKSVVKTKTPEIALKYLNSITGSKSRKYEVLKMSNYLTSQNEYIPIETAKFIVKIQSHMVETVKINFQAFYKPNLLYCSKLIGSTEIITYIPVTECHFILYLYLSVRG